MIYDAKFFDEVFERRGHDATKWDYPLFVKDNKDIVPMWVADMDFRTPDCIVDAMAKRLEHHAFGYFKIPQAYFDGIAKWQKERYGVDGVTADRLTTRTAFWAAFPPSLRLTLCPATGFCSTIPATLVSRALSLTAAVTSFTLLLRKQLMAGPWTSRIWKRRSSRRSLPL